ncbi:ATP adenylyltransferase [Methylococcales bacterium]|nr:ATP adenylyltransferase [Methylococcales bacterium]
MSQVKDDNCPFCNLSAGRIIQSDNLVLAIWDGFPISPGHVLILPKRHVGSIFDATNDEVSSLMRLLNFTKISLQEKFNPDGYNIGINDGPAAGQTIPHLHIHLIPRYKSDSLDPRGGIRWIIPEKADYWSKA